MGRKSKMPKLEKNVLKLVKTAKAGVTTKDVAEKFIISWNTAHKILKTLEKRGKILRVRYGRVNVWSKE